MNTAELESLCVEIRRITDETDAHKMQWGRSNPTTFTWSNTGTPAGRLSIERSTQLQIVSSETKRVRQVGRNYLFQVLDGRSNDARLAINTTQREHATLREPLEALFDVIEAGFDKAALVFLKQLTGERQEAARIEVSAKTDASRVALEKWPQGNGFLAEHLR